MNTNKKLPIASNVSTEDMPISDGQQLKRRKWPLKTLIELLPVIIALTVFFSYSSIKNVTNTALVTPLMQVVGGVPLWVTVLMGLILLIGLSGISWLIYIFSRAPIDISNPNEENDYA